jgi:hypothetical protein
MDYSNFDLKLFGEGPRRFYVEVIGSPQSMLRDPVALEIPDGLLARWRELSGGARDCERASEELGRALHSTLFPPAVMEVWHASRQLLGPRARLRLRLDIRTPQLSAVPWELIHDGGWYVARTRGTPVVRHPSGHPPIPPVSDSGPLNVLVLTSAPRAAPSLPEAEREVEAVMRSFSGLKAEGKAGRVDLIRHVTKESLRCRLQEHEYHVLHFIGHGEFEDEKGYLVFEDEGGGVELIGGEALAYRFKESALRLLFLNSCKSAVASSRGVLLGVAQAALAAGVPAAVAMQDEIGDAAAAAFAREFYKMLAKGSPLEVCVFEGRLGISEGKGPRCADWAVPVLFSNAEEGLLWKLPEAEVEREDRSVRNDNKGGQVVNQQNIHSTGDTNIFAQTLNNFGTGGKDDD